MGRISIILGLILGTTWLAVSAASQPGWSWIHKIPASGPIGLYGHAMTYDSTRKVVVLFGGKNVQRERSETWEWDGVTWTLRHPPTSPYARYRHAMAFDPIRNRVVLFGGWHGKTGTQCAEDTWEWDGNTWIQQNPMTSPPDRESPTMAFDLVTGKLVMFGGNGFSAKPLNDTPPVKTGPSYLRQLAHPLGPTTSWPPIHSEAE